MNGYTPTVVNSQNTPLCVVWSQNGPELDVDRSGEVLSHHMPRKAHEQSGVWFDWLLAAIIAVALCFLI